MSSEVSITISFPLGARFIRNPEIVFYNAYISFLKGLFCINTEKKCTTCPLNGECRYFSMTGNDFADYPGILMKTSYFKKLRYEKNEELEFRLFFIGNTSKFADSCILFLKEHLNQKLGGQFFCIKDYAITSDPEKLLSSETVRFISPVQSEEISTLIKQQLSFYNENYQTHFEQPTISAENSALKLQKRSGYKIDGKYLTLDGYIGTIAGTINNVPSFLSEYGTGKNNCIGGGQFETQNITS